MNSTTSGSTKSPASLLLLRILAVVTAVVAIMQATLGLMVAFGNRDMLTSHEPTGYLALGASVLTAIAAGVWAKSSGNKGLAWHALSVAVLALAQIGLAEMGLEIVHISVGFLFLIAAVALATLSLRKPGSRAARG